MFVIKAAVYILPIPFYRRFAHGFWVLEENSQIIAELHGLPTQQQSNKIVPIGYHKNHRLRAHHLIRCAIFAQKFHQPVSHFSLPIHKSTPIYTGTDTLSKWELAIQNIDIINQLDLGYPTLGFNLPLKKTINSNSIYRFFADVMNIEAYCFPGLSYLGMKVAVSTLTK